MATRSAIAIENLDGTLEGVYCHWDGYLSHNGVILQNFYTTEAQVRELIAEGDISSLGAKIGYQHNFGAPDLAETLAETRCTFYKRDRNEQDVDAKVYANRNEFVEDFKNAWVDYMYVFSVEHGSWTVRPTGNRTWVGLRRALARETLRQRQVA